LYIEAGQISQPKDKKFVVVTPPEIDVFSVDLAYAPLVAKEGDWVRYGDKNNRNIK